MKKLLTVLLVLISSINLYSQTELDSLVLIKINQYRISLGLDKLEFCKKSFLASEHHTKYMIDSKKLCHIENSETPKPKNRLSKYGVKSFHIVSENCSALHFNTLNNEIIAQGIFNNWKESPNHNNNMIRPELKYMGVSVIKVLPREGEEFTLIMATLVLWG